MFRRLVGRSMAARKARVALAVVAVMAGAAVASAMLNVSFSFRDNLAREFRGFGPNIVVAPRSDTIEVGLPGISFGSITEQGYINESELSNIKSLPGRGDSIVGYAPFLYQLVMAFAYGKNVNAVLAGTYFSHPEPNLTGPDGKPWTTGLQTISSWGVRGSWVADGDADRCMVGTGLAAMMSLRPGALLKVTYKNPATGASSTRMLNVTGIVTTGGTEDTMIFTNLLAAQELSSRPGLVHIVQVSALTSAASAETIAREIQSALPSVEAKSRLQLSKSEADLIQQTGSLVAMIAVVAMGATALGVAATMTTGVLERRREIGIMKAVGAGRRKVASMFLAEASLVGAAGGLLGALAGLALGMIIEERVFGWPATFQPAVLPLTVALSILVAAAASALPIWRALGIGPASVLRGD